MWSERQCLMREIWLIKMGQTILLSKMDGPMEECSSELFANFETYVRNITREIFTCQEGGAIIFFGMILMINPALSLDFGFISDFLYIILIPNTKATDLFFV